MGNDPDPNQPPAPNPPTTSQTGNLLNQGQGNVQVTWGGTGGQPSQGGVTLALGLPGFSEKHTAQAQLGVGNTGYSAQLQNNLVFGKDDTSQQSALLNAQLSMNPKLAGALGINFEQDWGGDNPQRPKYQLVEQLYGSIDKNAQIGPLAGTGYTGGVSVLGQRNFGLTADLNPKYSLGIEVKVQGTQLDPGKVDQFLVTGGAVAARNFTLGGGSTVVTVGGTVFVGGEKHTGSSVQPVWGGGVTAGVAFGGPSKTEHKEAPPAKEEPARVVETTVKGIVSECDAEHDRLVMDIGSGRTQEFKLSQLRRDAADPQKFDASMKRGERIDVTTGPSGRSHISQDYGRDFEWLKDDLRRHAQLQPNGDMTVGNLTLHKDLAQFYKTALARPYNDKENDLIAQMDSEASNKREATVFGRADQPAPDFSRGSGNLPKLAVHMAADGKGVERSAGAKLVGAEFQNMVEKDGVTTVNYLVGKRPQAISFPSTVGGYGNDPANPYNTGGIDNALKGNLASQTAREVALAGAKNLVRDLDNANGPTPLVSPKGTTPTDLLKRVTFDPDTFDVHIGNLTLKKDAAAYYLGALQREGKNDPELVARIERLADSKTPTEIDLAKTREAAFKARDELGFGEPPNPLKAEFANLKPNDKFDFAIDAKHAENARLVNRTQNVESTVHQDGRVDEPQPLAQPQHAHGGQHR